MTELIWLGQKIDYDAEKNLVTTEIREPFWKASEMLGWGGKSAGLGINAKILDFVTQRNADLFVYVKSERSFWKASAKDIFQFIKTFPVEWNVKGGKYKVLVLSWDIFKWTEAPINA